MKILLKENPRRIALITKHNVLLFRYKKTKTDSNSCAIEFRSREDTSLKGYKRLFDRDIFGFLGLIEVNGDIYICTITGGKQVASPIPKQSINKIFSVDFFCLNKPTWDYVDLDPSGYPILPEEEKEHSKSNGQFSKHPCTDLKKLLSTGGFYYSSDFDLTSSLQTRGFSSHSLSFDDYKDEYMWNSFMLKEMIDFRDKLDTNDKERLDDDGFLTTVIRGFAETFSTHVKRQRVNLTAISRQSWKRAGTRFNSRGIDDEGYVSNFVETELILHSDNMCYSFVEIRGSVPVFWEQDTSLMNPKVQITRSEEATQPVFDAHFKRLLENYDAVHIVNLLSTKTNEVPLSKRYRYHLKQLKKKGIDNVYLTDFDFHRETSEEGYSSSTKIFQLIKESLYEFGYFSYDVEKKKTLSKQSGVFRTNCLDCLDRTNLIQQYISNFVLTIFLKDQDRYISQDSDLFTKHNTLWADNGDQISQIYTGTNALKSSFSRSGKMSIAGALSDATKSVSRIYINNFVDKGKQANIDQLLGRLSGQEPVQLYDPINEFVGERLIEISNKFTSESNANIFVGSYNVNGIDKIGDLTGWLFPIGDKFTPNVVVLGLQEVIELTAGSILNADYSKSSFWTNAVSDCLNQFDKYVMLRAEQMSSLLVLLFVKADDVNKVKQVEGSSKKTGLGGMTGNKGAVAIRFNYGVSKFCFVNAHLAAGTQAIAERNNDYISITNGIKFARGGVINDNDNIFWLGDLNYRISLENEVVRAKLAEDDLSYLIEYDQLTKEIRSNNVFKGFAEPSLNFKPTYKFDKGTEIYDSSEKTRTPSWTDRIIYKGDNIKPLAYSSSKLLLSDHQPVYAAYKVKVKFVDEAKKTALSKKLYEEFRSQNSEPSSGSLVDLTDDSSLNTKKEELNLLDEDGSNYNGSDGNDSKTDGVLIPSKRNTLRSPLLPTPRSATPSAGSKSWSGSADSGSGTSPLKPPTPAPRKVSDTPPGFSNTVLKPHSKTPSRSSTPVVENKTTPVVPKKPTPFKSEPLVPKKPASLKSEPPVPKKPVFLKSEPPVPKKPTSLKAGPSYSPSPSVSSASSPPPPPPTRKVGLGLNEWKPLTPK